MLSEEEVRKWWDRLSIIQRIDKAKDLELRGLAAEWSRSFVELSGEQQKGLIAALESILPDPKH